MPNWCQNELTITSNTDKNVSELLDKIKGENGAIDFNSIIPYPQEYAVLDKARNDYIAENPEDRINAPNDGFNQGGYEWCVENWGTKWNACEVDLSDKDNDLAMIRFDTAWSPPEGILNKLRELFPDFNFSMFYREDGMQLSGYL